MTKKSLSELEKELRKKNEFMLRLEIIMAAPVFLIAFVMIMLAGVAEMPDYLRVVLTGIAVIMMLAISIPALMIEQKAGYYECAKCHHKYVPKSFARVYWAIHCWRTRYMKCPKCGEKSWQKKVL